MRPPGSRAKQIELFGREVEAGQWRRQLLQRLDTEGADDLADRLRKCGLEFNLWCKGCGHKHTAATKCCRKWCPSCAPKRANERAAKMRVAVRLMKWPMHITLTMRNVPLEDAPRGILRGLMRSFAKLRRTKLWRDCVRGGVVSVEVTDKGNGLHPHLHALIDCEWLALKTPRPYRDDDAAQRKEKFKCAAQELQGAWARCLEQETPPAIWIRRCDAGAADEVMKYALKTEDAINCRGEIAPVLRMLDAVRTVATFGSLRGMKVPDDNTHKLTCPNGHSEWTPTPPRIDEEKLTARQKLDRLRTAELDRALARILAAESAMTV